MSMNSRQRWMGGVVLLSGGVLLAALLLKGKDEIHHNQMHAPQTAAESGQKNASSSASGLTVDVETEKRLLEAQRQTREKSVAEQEARAAEFLAMQQQAEADAARKAAEEYAALNARRSAQQSSDNIPPELIEDDAAKQKRIAEEKQAAQKKLEQQKAAQQKAEQSKQDAARKAAEAEKRAAEEKRSAELKRKEETERLAAEKKAAEKKAADKKAADSKAAEEKRKAEEHKAEAKRKEDAKKKTEAEKARDLLEHGDKQWMVQVALAANQANADALASKLKAKGYRVTKSPTSKGIRIMVGPSKDREAADSARKKITSDAGLGMKSAWVIDWVPLDKR